MSELQTTKEPLSPPLEKLSAKIEETVAHNRFGDSTDLARAIDDLIIQRITDYHNANRRILFR